MFLPRFSLGLAGLGVTVTPQLQSLAQQIQTQEGYYPGSLSYQNNNPGNLKYAGQPGATSGPGGFAVFDSYQDGLTALYNQLGLYASGQCAFCDGQPQTIQSMMQIYAPSSDNNNPTQYASTIASNLGISTDDSVSDYINGYLNPSNPLPTSSTFNLGVNDYQDTTDATTMTPAPAPSTSMSPIILGTLGLLLAYYVLT